MSLDICCPNSAKARNMIPQPVRTRVPFFVGPGVVIVDIDGLKGVFDGFSCSNALVQPEVGSEHGPLVFPFFDACSLSFGSHLFFPFFEHNPCLFWQLNIVEITLNNSNN